MIPPNLRKMKYLPVDSSPLNRACYDRGLLADIAKHWQDSPAGSQPLPGSLQLVTTTYNNRDGDVYKDAQTGEVYVYSVRDGWKHVGFQAQSFPERTTRLNTSSFSAQLSQAEITFQRMQQATQRLNQSVWQVRDAYSQEEF